MNAFPKLETTRLLLDQITQADAETVLSIFSDSEVTRYYDLTFTELYEAQQLIEDDAQRFIDDRNLRWGVRDKSDNRLLGGCGVNRFEPSNHVAVIGYEFAKQHWGQGYAGEAVAKVIEYLFMNQCNHTVNRIEAYTMIGNRGSEVVLERLGFQCEGLLRQHGYWQGGYHDLKLYSLLRNDYVA